MISDSEPQTSTKAVDLGLWLGPCPFGADPSPSLVRSGFCPNNEHSAHSDVHYHIFGSLLCLFMATH